MIESQASVSTISTPKVSRGIVSPPIPCPPNCNGEDDSDNLKDSKRRKAVTGDGNVTKQVRMIKSFSEINIDGLFDVTISQGDKESVTVETDANLQEFVEVSNNGNSLMVGLVSLKIKKISHMKIHIVLKDVSKITGHGLGDLKTGMILKLALLELRINGVGDAKFKLDCNQFNLKCEGVADVYLSGTSKRVKMDCRGVGDIHAYDLKVTDLKLKQTGVGDTKVHVTGDLTIDFSGVGDISYKGEPKTKKIEQEGVGTVKAK